MYTFCPNCSAVYQITAGQLGKAGGQTRCGECRQVYAAVDYLYEGLTATRDALEQYRVSRIKSDAAAQDMQTAAEAAAEPARESSSAAEQPATLPAQPAADSWQYNRISMADIGSGAAIGLLLLLLAMQWVYFNRDTLVADDRWRPLLERGCAVVHCQLPLRVDLSRIDILSRDVRGHPVVDDALLVNVVFENRADFIQSWPLLEVSFTDLSGTPVAMRYFRPAEYLPEGIDLEAGMTMGTPVQVVLEIVDPGDEVDSFQFAFL